jgi:hypothetical protein
MAELVEATLTFSFRREEINPHCVFVLEGQDGYRKEVNATERIPQTVLDTAQNLLQTLAAQEKATLAQPAEEM